MQARKRKKSLLDKRKETCKQRFQSNESNVVGVCFFLVLDNKQSLLYSVSKAGALLDYAPQTSLAEGIKHFADWYKGYFNVVQTPSADES
jgi:nucleoside-diphosphate-sugar epimerase